MKTVLFRAAAVAVVVNAFSALVLACACCAEPGTYMISTVKPDSHLVGLISEFRFGSDASLYMTEAGFDGIRGLAQIRPEYDSDSWVAAPGNFDLAATFNAKKWRFTLKTKGRRSGTLSVPLPATMVNYKVDTHDEEGRPNGPLLYKELRFKGALAGGLGFFGPDVVAPTTYFLVFQGRGNMCDNAADFKHWRLEITGRRAEYAFFGKLAASDCGSK